MTLIQRFSLICFIGMAFFGLFLGLVITNSIEHNLLGRAKQMTATIVSDEVKREFEAAELVLPKIGAEYDDFSKKIRTLSRVPDILRIKIWNKDRKIVWSDERKLPGQSFYDNKHLNQSLKGEIVSDISMLEMSEHKFERQFKRLLELYVPIKFEPEGSVAAVFEIYQDIDPLYKDINDQKKIIWLSVITGFGVLYLFLFGIVWRGSKRIDLQNKEIKLSEEKYRSLVQSAYDAIISTDRDGNVTLFNESASRIFGYLPEDLIGKSVAVIVPENYRKRHEDGLKRFIETGEKRLIGRTAELEGLRKDGQVFPLELSLSVSGKADNLIITGILRDTSERREMQNQLIASERQESIATIASSIGHELKNIIQGLMGYADLMMMKPDDKELTKKCAEVFNMQSQRLDLHARNLLEMGKPREPQIKPVDINSLLDSVTNMLSISGLIKNYSIVKQYLDDALRVLGDETLLEQVISNLEINAAHAMGNTGTLTLNAVLSGDKSKVEFSISDTGHGIPEDKRDKIFLPFYTTKEKGKGTGLGLYVIKQIVEQHKGYIKIKSDVGVGTTIIIGLPAVQ